MEPIFEATVEHRLLLGQRDIVSALRALTKEIHRMSESQQHLDADVQAVTDTMTAIGDGMTAIEAEIAALKNQPGTATLDFTALDAAKDNLNAVLARIQGDAPAAPPAA
jgi:septal ring factor EnvC (AmiA/AmiB activator)